MFISIDSNQKLYEMVERSIQKGVLYHIFFWVVFFFFLIIVDQGDSGLGFKMLHKAIRIMFYVGIVYINLFFLFPRYLKGNRLLLYVLTLLILVSVITPVEVFIHYLLFSQEGAELASVFTLQNLSFFFIGSFFVAFSSSIYKIISDWMEHQRERSELQKQNLKSELKFLKTQINPHFFFNTLNSLYALTLKKSDRAPEIVLKLSEMMRYMLYDSNVRTVPLENEINYMKNYLELEEIRHAKNFKINFEVNGRPEGHQIAPLLFIPFLENSFKHGIDHELNSGYVEINLNIEDNGLTLMVKNSKPTAIINPGKKKVGGIGLVNVRRRLNILYPSKYSLDVKDDKDEFVVHMELKQTKMS